MVFFEFPSKNIFLNLDMLDRCAKLNTFFYTVIGAFPPVVRELLKVEKWFKLTHHSIICNEVNLNTVNGEHLCDG